MGSATAWQLARRGHSVVLLEQFGPGHQQGSSHGATRIFRVAYRDPTYVRLATESLRAWAELQQESGQVLLEQSGQIDHGDPEAIEQVVNNLEAAGFEAERLSPTQAQELWPGMRFDQAVVHSVDGGRVFADRTVQALHQCATTRGVTVAFHEPVQSIDSSADGVVLQTPLRKVHAGMVVIAAGAWVEDLLPGEFLLPKLTVSEQVPVHFRKRNPSMRWPSFLHHMHANADALTFGAYGMESPLAGSAATGSAASNAESLGLKVGVDNATDVGQVVAYVNKWHPGMHPDPVSSTQCLFTSTSDQQFILQRQGPIVVCSPCSGHGFKFTPMIGELVADMCEGLPARYNFSSQI
ncbi:glycine/D-amino acid oxidase, deaminating [Actinobacteria bacterium IMCC26207]|nr:glycine/D-amino acid oxidase, deaminating [Actinobacteria bacterium IMCC26207]